MDYETAQTHEFALRCFDTGGREDYATVTINVLPVNDVQPQFNQTSYTFTVNRISSPSSDFEIGRVTAVDQDRDIGGVITYSIEENENFRISSNDGRILLADFILVLEGSSFNLTVVVDDGEFNATSLVYITVTGLLSILILLEWHQYQSIPGLHLKFESRHLFFCWMLLYTGFHACVQHRSFKACSTP